MAKVKMYRGLQASYDALPTKDIDAVYICKDSGRCFLGDIPLSPKSPIQLNSGLRIYYNGSEVTLDTSMQQEVAYAPLHWYGSFEDYEALLEGDDVQDGIAYHIMIQPNWDESNISSLAYIKNKPALLDVAVENVPGYTSYLLRFFKTQQ